MDGAIAHAKPIAIIKKILFIVHRGFDRDQVLQGHALDEPVPLQRHKNRFLIIVQDCSKDFLF